MIIDYKNKLVFIANSKSASTSIEESLMKFSYCGHIGGCPSLKHMSFKTFQEIKKPLGIEKFITWCLVRNPIEKLVSWYNYRSRKSIKDTERYTGDKTFLEFLNSLSSKNIHEYHDVSNIHDNNNNAVDIVFDYSNTSELQKFLR